MSFKIGKYIGSQLESKSSNNNITFILKGKNSSDDIIVSKEELVDALSNLRDNADVPLKRLSGNLKQNFELISKYVSYTHQTNTYSMLKDLIDEYFYDLSHVEPGTIGSYFSGSSINVNMDPPECSAVGANSIPKDYSKWNNCKHNIILADSTNHGYDFALLSEGEDKSHTYVYVRHDTYSDFPGFTDEEKRKLKKFGVDYVNLYGYGEDSSQYNDLVGTTIHINDVKSRHHENKDHKGGSGWWVWIIVFFIIIILILAIAFSYK